jgi:hypothetical protein
VKIAYAEQWLRFVLSSNATMQGALGASWQGLAVLVALIGEAANLAMLAGMPAVEVAVLVGGAVYFVLISYEDVVLRVQPFDANGRALPVGEETDHLVLERGTKLMLEAVAVDGFALERTGIA